VWSYDFVAERTQDSRPFRILNGLDESTRECLASLVARRLGSQEVRRLLTEHFLRHGVPPHMRSDTGPACIAKKRRHGLNTLEVEPLSLEPGSPWENGFIESFNARLRDELLDGEIFYTLNEAQIVIESWRRFYNTERPHGSLGYKPPAPEVFIPAAKTPTRSSALADRPLMH